MLRAFEAKHDAAAKAKMIPDAVYAAPWNVGSQEMDVTGRPIKPLTYNVYTGKIEPFTGKVWTTRPDKTTLLYSSSDGSSDYFKKWFNAMERAAWPREKWATLAGILAITCTAYNLHAKKEVSHQMEAFQRDRDEKWYEQCMPFLIQNAHVRTSDVAHVWFDWKEGRATWAVTEAKIKDCAI